LISILLALHHWLHIKVIVKITLSLSPSFILKFFFSSKCWIFANESKLWARRNNFLIKEDEKQQFFRKGHLLHNIHKSDNQNENKSETQVETHFYHQPWEKGVLDHVYYQCIFFHLNANDPLHALISYIKLNIMNLWIRSTLLGQWKCFYFSHQPHTQAWTLQWVKWHMFHLDKMCVTQWTYHENCIYFKKISKVFMWMENNNKFSFLEFWIHENHDLLSKTYKVGTKVLWS